MKKSKSKNLMTPKSVIDNLPQYIYWKDRTRTYRGCNKNVAVYLGLDSNVDMNGKTDNDFWSDPDRLERLKKEDDRILFGEYVIIKEQIPGKESINKHMLTSKNPFYDSAGNIIGILGVSTDIDEQVKLEQELQAKIDRANVLMKAKSNFIANISHDIRTPLNGIIGIAEILSELVKIDKEAQYVKYIIEAGKSLLSLLNGAITMISVDQKDTDFSEIDACDLRKIIIEIHNLVEPLLYTKNLKCLLKIDKSVPEFIFTDTIKLKRIFLNLISNAIKFTDKGLITVRVKVNEKIVKQGEIALDVSIKDTGVGIAQKSLNKIFDRFYKVKSSSDANTDGYGIGLHAAQQFARFLGSEIKVKSKLNFGSKFYFTLTAKIPSKEEIDKSKNNREGIMLPNINYKDKAFYKNDPSIDLYGDRNITRGSDNRKLRALLVEDDNLTGMIDKKIVEDLGLIAELVKTGQEALEFLADREPYDIIFLDMGLPDISGALLAEEIRKNEVKENKLRIPVIALTAYASKKQCREYLMNCDAVFIKPITKEIQIEIMKFLSKKN